MSPISGASGGGPEVGLRLGTKVVKEQRLHIFSAVGSRLEGQRRFRTISTATTPQNLLLGRLSNHDFTGTATTAVVAGDILTFACILEFTAFSSLNADNLAGVAFCGTADAPFIKTGNTERIVAGVDSAGNLWLVVASGSGVTATDTGIDIIAGDKKVLTIVFTQGTSVELQVNGVSVLTITTTLPTLIPWNFTIGKGNHTGATNLVELNYFDAASRYEEA